MKHRCVLFIVSPYLLQCMYRILDPLDWADDVPGLIHLSAFTDLGGDLVEAEAGAWSERHGRAHGRWIISVWRLGKDVAFE